MNKSECFYDGCGSITKQDMSVANKCTVKDMVGENIDGCRCFRLVVNSIDVVTNKLQGSPTFRDFLHSGNCGDLAMPLKLF